MTRPLLTIKKKNSGRDVQGHVSVRHRGGEHKRYLRLLDLNRLPDIEAKVVAIEYDPNRTAKLAKIVYTNGRFSYILATAAMKVGQKIISSESATITDGNRLPLRSIPPGIPFHCLQMFPQKPAQMVMSAGSAAYLQSLDGSKAVVKLPSGEIRQFSSDCWVTISQVSFPEHANIKLRKAGDSRRRGIRPSVRGVAQHPDSHPHGGGEGRSSVGMNPKTPWGRPAMGKRTRSRKKSSSKLIIKRRR